VATASNARSAPGLPRGARVRLAGATTVSAGGRPRSDDYLHAGDAIVDVTTGPATRRGCDRSREPDDNEHRFDGTHHVDHEHRFDGADHVDHLGSDGSGHDHNDDIGRNTATIILESHPLSADARHPTARNHYDDGTSDHHDGGLHHCCTARPLPRGACTALHGPGDW